MFISCCLSLLSFACAPIGWRSASFATVGDAARNVSAILATASPLVAVRVLPVISSVPVDALGGADHNEGGGIVRPFLFCGKQTSRQKQEQS